MDSFYLAVMEGANPASALALDVWSPILCDYTDIL